jgi:hypothetical protein
MAAKDPRPDWRQGNKRATGAAPAAGAGKRDWQRQSAPAAGPRKPWSRGSKLAFAVVLLSLFVGGMYIVIEWIRPVSPTCLVLVGASYDENLAIPHNAFGWKNLEEVGKLKDEPGLYSDSGKPSVLPAPGELKGANAWQKEWEKLQRQIREKTVVVFLALHGAADSNGAYFFVSDEQDRYARLPLAEVVKSLESNELADKNVLLIVEPALSRANWSTGVLDNTFVAKLQELRPKLKSNLFILCASDVYQTSWTSEEWQQTVFGHYVVEGLRGAADLDGNTRVTIGELGRYVNDKVVSWSQRNRAAEQTPILLGSETAADEVEIAQVASEYKERPGDAPGLDAKIPPGLKDQWTEWRKLGKMTPHPAVYSPALWRRYQDLLVRYEQLLRAGDPTKKAGDIAGKLVAMRKKLEAEARFDPAEATLSLSFPMAETLGIPLPLPDAELRAKLQKIWDAGKSEQRIEFFKELTDWAKRQDDVKLSQMRVQIYRSFLDFVAQSPGVRDTDLVGAQADKDDPRPRVVALLDLLESKLGLPRPAEVHFLTMLLKDISSATPPEFERLRESLLIRLLAERAALAVGDGGHPYSEVLLPWNRERIAAADSTRRPGEDLLFATTSVDWDRSRQFLDRAKTAYLLLQKDSAIYRRGLEVRDRAAAELPYLALWVANQRVSSDKTHNERVDDWAKLTVQFSQRLDALHAELSKEKNVAPSTNVLRGLIEQVVETQTALKDAMGGEIAKANQNTHSHPLWYDREAILSVPPLRDDEDGVSSVEVRLAMLDFNRATSARFFKTQKADKAFGGEAKKDAETLAKRNQQLAMATFKNYWPLELARVENDGPMQVGEEIAKLTKRWATDVSDGLSQSLKEGDLNAAGQLLRKADFLSRGLPGGFEDRAEPMSASQALRSLRIHDLLVAQAKRTLLDHWFSEVPDSPPYYETAAKQFLTVARQLAEVKGETRDSNKLRTLACTRMIDALKTVGLQVVGKEFDYWTSEKEFPVRWTIVTPDDPYAYDPKDDDAKSPPPAIAITWRKLDGPGKWKDEVADGQRKSIELAAGSKHDFSDSYFLNKDKGDDALLTARYTVLLRGQQKTETLKVSQKDPDVIVHDFPRPNKSLIKVRMSPEFTYGAIAIALDISGSMIWRKDFGIDVKGERKTRLELAKDALRTTLKSIPKDTFVSLTAFVTKEGKFMPEIVPVRPPLRWEGSKLEGLLEDIDALAARAWKEDDKNRDGATPIAYLMDQCAQNGFPAANVQVRGPRVLLVLSDGDDNKTGAMLGADWPDMTRQTISQAEQDTYNRRVREFVAKSLGKRDIEVHFACFLDESKFKKEAANALAQFKETIENFEPAGKFTIIPDSVALAKTLQQAIRPRLLVTLGSSTPPNYDPEGEYASLPNDEKNWLKLDPETYSIQVKGSPARDLKLTPGTMLALALKRDTRDPRKVTYEREAFIDLFGAETKPLAEVKANQGRYRVAVLQNQRVTKSNEMIQAIAIEEAATASQLIQQAAPKFVWLESKPKSAPPPRLSRWYRDIGFPAQVFRVIGEDWPLAGTAAAPAEINVWMTDNPDSESFASSFERSMKKNRPETVKFKDQSVVIEDVSIEEKMVVPAGEPKVNPRKVLKQCLVVRVACQENRPVMIQFLGGHKGEEHHFFHSANKYTAMFWDLSNPGLETANFNVIFLDALKKDVTPASFLITGSNRNFPEPEPKMVGN